MLLRWGLCGAGKVCFDFANALMLAPDRHRLQAVAARDLDRAQELADKFRIPKAYAHYAELASDPDVDAVYVGTVNNTHLELCKLYLEAGKPVLCEKALCCGAPQTRELVDVAQRRGVFLMEGLWNLTLPAYAKLRELLADQTIGSVRAVETKLMLNRAHVERINDAQLGGGVLWFHGVYGLSLIDMVFGGAPWQRVHAVGTVQDGIDATVCANLQLAGGRFATLFHSAVMEGDFAAGHASATVYGDAGYMRILFAFSAPTCIEVVAKQGLTEISKHKFEFEYPRGPFKANYYETGGLIFEADHVRECLTRGLLESPLVPLEASVRIQETADAIRAQLGLHPLAPMPLPAD